MYKFNCIYTINIYESLQVKTEKVETKMCSVNVGHSQTIMLIFLFSQAIYLSFEIFGKRINLNEILSLLPFSIMGHKVYALPGE